MIVRFVAIAVALAAFLVVACAPATQKSPSEEPSKPAATAAPAASTESRNVAPAAPASGGSAAKPAAKPATAQPAAESLANRQADAAQPRPPVPAPTPSTGDQRSTDLPIIQNLGRMIIYTTDLTILVEDVDAVPQHLANLALAAGGYVAGVEARDEGGLPTTIVKLKVPPQKYAEVMRGLRGLAVEVRGEKATTQDVTEEYSDVQTQLASLEAAHAQLLELQKRAQTVEEVLRIQQEAQRIKVQIDRLKGRATALERLTEFATITVRAQAADVVLRRDYVAVRSQLRNAEANRANLELQLQRARTPEEQAAIRDRLAEVLLEIARLQSRVSELEALANHHNVTLPTADASTVPEAKVSESLPQQYIDTRVALRRAEYLQTELMKAIQAGRPDADRAALTQAILDVNRLRAELKAIQERAGALGITLPTISPEQEAVLAGIPEAPSEFDILARVRTAWDASLGFLLRAGAILASAVVFLWWTLPLLALAIVLVRRRQVAQRDAHQARAASEP